MQNRSYLHNRHRLSHKQIDILVGKESGKSFLDEKLNSLTLVSEFLSVVKMFNSKSIFFISLKGPLLSQRIYSDSTIRTSHDIDIFIKKEDFNTVYELMIANEYKLCRNDVWPSASHIAFCKEGSKFTVDIRWQLFDCMHISHKKLSHIIDENIMELSFNGERVICFSAELDLIYIMIHGSRHGWCCLKWIVDIKDYPTDILDIEKFTELLSVMKMKRVLTQTNFIMYRFFNTKLPFTGSRRVNSYLLSYPISCINSDVPERYTINEVLKKFLYNFLLFPGVAYKVRLITSLILRSSDAESFIRRRLING